MHFLSTYSVGKMLSRMDKSLILWKEFSNSTTHTRNGQNAQHCEKEVFDGKVQKKLLSSFQKAKPTQISGSVFADGTEQVKKTKFELELIRTVDCFLYGHGNFTTTLAHSKTKSL